VGEVRDSDPRFPEFMTYEVRVGTTQGVPCAEVVDQLARFEEQMQSAVGLLDPRVRHRFPPALSGALLSSILVFCANAHGEWIRIRPFANGNGRTARLWVLWVGSRYALPPFVGIKPRPHGYSYASAAAASMRGDHRPMVTVFSDMLADRMRRGAGGP